MRNQPKIAEIDAKYSGNVLKLYSDIAPRLLNWTMARAEKWMDDQDNREKTTSIPSHIEKSRATPGRKSKNELSSIINDTDSTAREDEIGFWAANMMLRPLMAGIQTRLVKQAGSSGEDPLSAMGKIQVTDKVIAQALAAMAKSVTLQTKGYTAKPSQDHVINKALGEIAIENPKGDLKPLSFDRSVKPRGMHVRKPGRKGPTITDSVEL